MAGTSAAPAFSAALLFPLLPGLPYLVLAAVLAFGCPNGLELLDRIERADAAPRRRERALLGCGVVAALSICTVFATGTYEFLYFQF